MFSILSCFAFRPRRLVLACGLLALLSGAATAWALPPVAVGGPATKGIAVIYPDVAEPYRSVFAQIVGGIEEKLRGRVTAYVVGAEVDAGDLNESLGSQGTKVMIALGRQGMKAATGVDRDIGVVVGGVMAAPGNGARNMQVHSLSPDPALLFSRLKEVLPGTRRVFVVYDPRKNEWLIRLAKSAALAQGLELEACEAQDLRGAMRAYQDIFAAADPRLDALWLPQDSTTVEESTVLPLVLQESWARNLAVFSSNSAHVRRGALFSMYPDSVELGRLLAVSAQSLLAAGDNGGTGMFPLRAVQVSLNLRTAKHLGIAADRMRGFDMSFPEK